MKAFNVSVATILTVLFFAMSIAGPYFVGVTGNECLGVPTSDNNLITWGQGLVYILLAGVMLFWVVVGLTFVFGVWSCFYHLFVD